MKVVDLTKVIQLIQSLKEPSTTSKIHTNGKIMTSTQIIVKLLHIIAKLARKTRMGKATVGKDLMLSGMLCEISMKAQMHG